MAEDHDRVALATDGAPGEAGLSREAAADVATVTKGGAVQIVGQVSQRGLTFLFTVVAVAYLGKAGYGVYRQVAQVLAIGGQLGLLGFNYAAMRFIARARARDDHAAVRGAARTALAGATVASVVVLAALLLAAPVIARRFADSPADVGRFAYLFRLGALYVPLFAVMQVLRYCTQAYKTMVPSVTVGNVIQPVARFSLGVAALLLGFGVAGAVTTLVASVAVGAIAAGLYYQRILSDPERTAAPRMHPGPIVRFALPQAGASLLGIQALGFGVILLGAYSTDAAAGVFAVALALQGPGTVFLSGIVNIWAPVVSDLYDRGEIARLGSLYQTITRWVATFSFPVLVALILEADLFVDLFFPRAQGAEAVVAILAAGNLFYAGTGPTGYVISMTGHPGVNFVNSLVAVVAYVGLGALVVPDYGAVGMAWVDAGVTAAINAARVVEAWVLVGVQPFGRSFLKPVVATTAGAAVLLASRLLPGRGTGLQLGALAVAAIVYVGVLKAFGLDAEERYVWQRIRRRALKRGRRS